MANDEYIYGGLLLLFIAFAAMGGGDDEKTGTRITLPKDWGGGPLGKQPLEEIDEMDPKTRKWLDPFAKPEPPPPPAWLQSAYDGYT